MNCSLVYLIKGVILKPVFKSEGFTGALGLINPSDIKVIFTIFDCPRSFFANWNTFQLSAESNTCIVVYIATL